ncbi:MAG TPA: DedA family protein [Candidatus Paceibacterota bacterium]|nr:DedA family protein [Candidatus Paceibacterota bacterium]
MLDLTGLIQTAGYLGVAVIVFTESGLLIGVILPGDSLLFTAGFLASQGYLNIAVLIVIAFSMAVLGDNVGYWLGRRFGPTVFSRKDSLLLDPKHIVRAEQYYAKHGPKTIILARFIPVIRTIAPVLAGVGNMHWQTFMRYNVVGGVIWGIGVPLLGYWLGSAIPGIDRYLLPIIAFILLSSVFPGLWQFFSSAENRRHLNERIHRWWIGTTP